MNPYRINDVRAKYLTRTWWLPYNFYKFVDGKATEEINWESYWEKELNKFCVDNDVYLVSHSISRGVLTRNPLDETAMKYPAGDYGVMIHCVFSK